MNMSDKIVILQVIPEFRQEWPDIASAVRYDAYLNSAPIVSGRRLAQQARARLVVGA